MNDLSRESLGRVAEQIPASRPFFEKLGLDYCCGGRQPLDEACRGAGIPVATVVAALETLASAGATGPAGETRWSERPLAELLQHLLRTHHPFTREALVRIRTLLDRVLAAHGPRHPELARLDALFGELTADLGPHMAREEMLLFPRIAELERAGTEARPPVDGVAPHEPIALLVREHESVGALLAEGRTLTAGWAPPADGCATFQALYEALDALEKDVHVHVHLENNVLFPRVLALEERLAVRAD